ncbi:uncharacterized protein LTR77_000719 [Saxophila tyrrhenica]|uniref:Uncharacterized protein n=1 Tax=Saxophila tyrrhenica TaxID=1690608 RepID=A0AAV9PTC1_9PEZI|nr:hypothetical protein LTR77_000719 [Saxophila tyrrhenica]
MAVHEGMNGTVPLSADDDQLLTELNRLKDAVLEGHSTLALPSAAIERLRAALLAPDAPSNGFSAPQTNALANGSAYATNQTQPQKPSSFSLSHSLPGLQKAAAPSASDASQVYGTKPSSAAGLDPIFLEKSDSLVRAEGQLKRQRLDRELQNQVDHGKQNSRDREHGVEASSSIDVDAVLASALRRVKPVSGLEANDAASSSFDENDYYSSQVQSDWSSEASSKNGSDRAADSFTADFERLDGAPQPSSSRPKQTASSSARPAPHSAHNVPRAEADDDMYDPEDGEYDDDVYTPPDPPAIGHSQAYEAPVASQQRFPVEREDSDYEPGEITAGTEPEKITADNVISTQLRSQKPAPAPRQVPIIRNHLTHIAAPQPNRVSPLATAKASNYELELVNGSPQVVQKPQQYPKYVPARQSSASPPVPANISNGKKKKAKKRKREPEPAGRSKKRNRQNAPESAARPTQQQEPYIKDEPVSPPPFNGMVTHPGYGQPPTYQRPPELDLVTPRQAPLSQYSYEPPRSGLRYEYGQPAGSAVVRVGSPALHRPVQRDTQDLRRVASMHYAQRPASPPAAAYSPVGPYQRRTSSMTYGDSRVPHAGQYHESVVPSTFAEQPNAAPVYYESSDRSRSPPRYPEYQDPYAQSEPSTNMMPPPDAAPKRIIVDQYGNRYMEAGPAPAQPQPQPARYAPSRASMAPIETRPYPEMTVERAPSRASVAYAPQPPQTVYYQPADRGMPPPPSRRQPESQYAYVDSNGVSVREYLNRPAAEPPQYAPQPTSPVYQQVRAYDQMPPPPAPPARNDTAPAYAPSRSYSVVPEEPQYLPASYVRQSSVAPIQYVRQEPAPAPPRAVSVMPPPDYRMSAQPAPQRTYSQAPPQSVRYVDQYGKEVYPQQVSQVHYQ